MESYGRECHEDAILFSNPESILYSGHRIDATKSVLNAVGNPLISH